ncbi:MAG: signal recognition particle-docking protein FtsY [Sandaracinaceae bacterium]|nr:signal recognition particle-docking protein FtsY [Sandaracinaceae bacterium]
MSIVPIILAAVVLLGLVIYFATRSKQKALPKDGEPTSSAKLPVRAAGQTAPKSIEEKTELPATLAGETPSPIPSAAQRVPRANPTPGIPIKAEFVEPLRSSVRPGPEDDVVALKKGLASTRGGFVARLAKMLTRGKEIDAALLEQIEEVLITADLGVSTTQKLLERLRERLSRNELKDESVVWQAIRDDARDILGASRGGIAVTQKPTVILVVGVNGVGKTTTIGKLASRFQQQGRKVVLAAGDTFRAAAVLQLEVWGRRVGCPVVKGKENGDPSAVIFDAIQKAKADGADIVLCDTAGRLHTKTPLMDELKKVGRTVEKALDGRPADEVLLVLDSTNGQNAIQQVSIFKALPLSGIALTKLDGTAKGGVILGIVDEHQIPVRYIGIGERVEDLREFDATSFVQALFEKPEDETIAA